MNVEGIAVTLYNCEKFNKLVSALFVDAKDLYLDHHHDDDVDGDVNMRVLRQAVYNAIAREASVREEGERHGHES